MPEPQNPPCCPGEDDCPAGAPGAIEDHETIARFIPDIDWITWDDDGVANVSVSAFSQKELNSKVPDKSSCSLGRSDKMSDEEFLRCASNRNKCEAWNGNPVTAYALTEKIRTICDDFGRQEACVYADPLDGFTAHAFLRRGEPPLDGKRKMEWAVFRRKVALEFNKVYHYSGAIVSEPRHLTASREADTTTL